MALIGASLVRLKDGVGPVLNKLQNLPVAVPTCKDDLLNAEVFPNISQRCRIGLESARSQPIDELFHADGPVIRSCV